MEKTKILGTGLTGLVGSRVVELLKHKYRFEQMSHAKGIDIVDRDAVTDMIAASEAKIVFHAAAKTDVEGCEQDRYEGVAGEAWYMNVYGTQNVADACRETGKKLIYISTGMVFGGGDTPEGGYREDSKTHPLSWYAQTKYEGEKVVKALDTPWVIMRIDYPYRAKFLKLDFVRLFLKFLQEKKEVSIVTDHKFNPTYIDDIAFALDTLIQKEATGVYHVAGSETVTPYEAIKKIAEMWDLDMSNVKETTRHEFFKGKAPRGFDLTMNNDKIRELGVQMRTFTEGLEEIKKSLEETIS